MLTLNRLLQRLSESGRGNLEFQGTHYENDKPVWSGDLWRLFGNAIGDAPENKTASRNMRRLESMCDAAGIELRFYDEVICDDNGRVHESQPGMYGDRMTWVILGDGEIWAEDEAADRMDDYAERLTYTGGSATLDRWNTDFATIGFAKWTDEAGEPTVYESGFHHGQTDTPEPVADAIWAKHGADCEIIFAMDDSGQFDVHWSAWFRTPAMRDAYLDAEIAKPSPVAQPAAQAPRSATDLTMCHIAYADKATAGEPCEHVAAWYTAGAVAWYGAGH